MNPFALALRALRRNAAFTTTAVVTLALGIGASTAIFSVANAVLLRPLPYANPQSLVIVTSDFEKRGARDLPVPPADLNDLRARVTRFSGMAGVSTVRQALTGDDAQPEQVVVANVTTNLFSLFGAKIVTGRDFVDADGAPPPADPAQAAKAEPAPTVVMLSYEFWKRRYGGNAAILNRTVTLGQNRALIVGIAPQGFEFVVAPSQSITHKPDVYSAMRVDWANAPRMAGSLNVFARLRDGATIESAQGELDAATAELRSRFEAKETAGLHYRAEPMAADAVRSVRAPILALMGSALFVLLIACANVANLVLVRSAAQESDRAVRAALGATSGDIARQLLTESLLLAAAGAAAGLVLAVFGVRALALFAPAELPRIDAVSIDGTVLAFTVLMMLVATGLFGAFPALRASRPDLMAVLRPGGRIGGLSTGRVVRQGVVIAEVALAFALLVGCGLMVRSYSALTSVNPGYDPNTLVTFELRNGRLHTPAEKAAFAQGVHDGLAKIPGVQSVSAGYPFPLDGNTANLRWGTDAAAADPAKFQQGNARFVLPGYFETMRTPVLDGRTFTDADNVPDAKVVVIDNLLAAKAFPGQSAVGKRILSRFRTPEPEWFDVIGVVAHQRHETLARDGRETLFFSDGMIGHGFATHWAVRTARTTPDIAPAIRATIKSIDPLVPVAELKPMSDDVHRAQATTRFALICLVAFASIAVALAVVGLFGTLATVVRQRTTEIGMRMAMGAPRSEIYALIIGQGMRLTAVGIAVGFAGALALSKVMSSLLVGVAPNDPLTFMLTTIVLAAAAAVGCWIPARRAATLQPAVALRDERATSPV